MISDEKTKQFVDQVEDKKSLIMVLGLGYTGLPLAECIVRAGFDVVGYDTNSAKVQMLNNGESYSETFSSARLEYLIKSGRFKAVDNVLKSKPCDIYWVCVPTPLLNGSPSLSCFYEAISSISLIAKDDFLIVNSSTSFPGTTQAICQSVFGKDANSSDYFLAYSPEREDPGNDLYSTKSLPRVYGALDSNSSIVANALFRQLFDQIHQASSIQTAEASKLMENVFRAVNIALANEWSDICSGLNVDVWEVIKLAATKPFGFQAFYPGPGVGGHCIPVDPYYLLSRVKSFGCNPALISLACDLNKKRPNRVVSVIKNYLNANLKPLEGSNALVIGAGYKKNLGDIRESPSVEIIKQLHALGCNVIWHDPLVDPGFNIGEIPRVIQLNSILVEKQDFCLVLVDHDKVEWKIIFQNASIVFDAKNKFLNQSGSVIAKVIKI